MKLFAIVGPDGSIKAAYPRAVQADAYLCGMSNRDGFQMIELHTYDPSKQVVVDRDTYNYVREYAKFHSDPFSDKFLKAGEMK